MIDLICLPNSLGCDTMTRFLDEAIVHEVTKLIKIILVQSSGCLIRNFMEFVDGVIIHRYEIQHNVEPASKFSLDFVAEIGINSFDLSYCTKRQEPSHSG